MPCTSSLNYMPWTKLRSAYGAPPRSPPGAGGRVPKKNVISNWLFIFRHRPSATAAATDALPSLPTKMDLPWSNAISSKRGRNGSSGESTTKTAAEQQLQVYQTSYSAVKPKCDVVFIDTLCSGVSHHTHQSYHARQKWHFQCSSRH